MTKLCPRGKAAAKRKFKVYPSAYANSYASKICAGKIKDPSGVKRKDFKGPKPSSSKVASAAKRVRSAKDGDFMEAPKSRLTEEGKKLVRTKNFRVYPSAYKRSAGKRAKKKLGGEMKVKKAGLGMLALGAIGATALRNLSKKKKNSVEANTPQGQINPVTGEGTEQPGANETNEKMMAAIKNMNKFGALSKGGMTPQGTGSYLKINIDGDESFTNASAQAYYKDLLKGIV